MSVKKKIQSFSGNYQDCLSDVKAATTLQASYLKAIIRGKNKKKFVNMKFNLNLAFFRTYFSTDKDYFPLQS